MRKNLYLGACVLAAAMGANAAPITPQQALQRVAANGPHKVMGLVENTSSLVYTYQSQQGDAAVYVFGNGANEGYMLLSADDAVAPLLGYADNGVFDEDNMPPQLEAWLAEYARQMDYARECGLSPYKASETVARPAVEPLMKTIWNQSTPFNLYTPKVYGNSCPTGCVATAMAQVMKYWNYPETAVGTGVITNPVTGRNESMVLGEESFEWDKMLDSYNGNYTEEEAHAVAYLMKACGYAAQMSYSSGVSGAFSLIAGKSLIDNFLYNPNIQYCLRDYYTASQWDEMVYNEVSNGRPVLYGAQSTSGGHEFVCDGYSGDGFYHFNWGWGGMSDGYFILDSLNPGAIGIGGGAGGGFNYKQDILIGVQPQEEVIYYPNLTQMGELTATAKDFRITFKLNLDGSMGQWINANLEEIRVNMGVAIEPADKAGQTEYISAGTAKRVSAPEYRKSGSGSLSISYSGVSGTLSFNFPEEIADGRYRVIVCTKSVGSDEWIPVLTQENAYNYVYVTKNCESLEIENMPEATITLDNAELKSPLYYGTFVKCEVKITNNSEKEITRGFYPELSFNGRAHMLGDGIVVTIPPKETIVREFTTQFRLLSGASAPNTRTFYTLRWLDPNSNTYYNVTEDVEMNVITTVPYLTVTDFTIANEETKRGLVAGAGMMDVYQITNIEDIRFDLSMINNRGFFGYPLYLVIFPSVNTSTEVMRSIFEPLTTLEEGDSCQIGTNINMSVGTLNTTYLGFVFYQSAKGMVQLESAPLMCFKLVGGGSGVEEIDSDENAPVVYYNLQGQEVKNPAKGELVIKKQGSKTEKIVF